MIRKSFLLVASGCRSRRNVQRCRGFMILWLRDGMLTLKDDSLLKGYFRGFWLQVRFIQKICLHYINHLTFQGTTLSRNYSEPTTTANGGTSSHNGTNGYPGNGTMRSSKSQSTTASDYHNGSMLSANTQHTYITSPVTTTQAYIENCGSSISNRSNDGGSSQVSLLNGNSSNGSQSTIAFFSPDYSEYDGILSVLEFDGTRLIFQGEIGRVS